MVEAGFADHDLQLLPGLLGDEGEARGDGCGQRHEPAELRPELGDESHDDQAEGGQGDKDDGGVHDQWVHGQALDESEGTGGGTVFQRNHRGDHAREYA